MRPSASSQAYNGQDLQPPLEPVVSELHILIPVFIGLAGSIIVSRGVYIPTYPRGHCISVELKGPPRSNFSIGYFLKLTTYRSPVKWHIHPGTPICEVAASTPSQEGQLNKIQILEFLQVIGYTARPPDHEEPGEKILYDLSYIPSRSRKSDAYRIPLIMKWCVLYKK